MIVKGRKNEDNPSSCAVQRTLLSLQSPNRSSHAAQHHRPPSQPPPSQSRIRRTWRMAFLASLGSRYSRWLTTSPYSAFPTSRATCRAARVCMPAVFLIYILKAVTRSRLSRDHVPLKHVDRQERSSILLHAVAARDHRLSAEFR